MHVDEVDKRAIAAITVFCPNLVKFGLINCEFTEIRGAVDEQGWEMMRSGIEALLFFVLYQFLCTHGIIGMGMVIIIINQ